jgi:hypothetical protein
VSEPQTAPVSTPDPPTVPPSEALAGPEDAAALFAAFARMEGLEASYVEHKYLALLALPLTSSGRLYYLRPGHMTRVVDGDPPTILAISPERLTMTGPEGVEVMELGTNATLRLFVTSLVRVFAGDERALAASYEIEFTRLGGDEPAESAPPSVTPSWTLVLRPRAEPLTNMLRELRLTGSGFEVTQLSIVEPNGDRTLTDIQHADTQRAFSAQEREQLFGIPPS